jgi:hypothetical protein
MPRLIAADLYVGRCLRLGDVRYRIGGFENHGATLVLVVQDDSRRLVSISRGAFLARLCDETATFETWSTGGPPT